MDSAHGHGIQHVHPNRVVKKVLGRTREKGVLQTNEAQTKLAFGATRERERERERESD